MINLPTNFKTIFLDYRVFFMLNKRLIKQFEGIIIKKLKRLF